ncbi:Sec-independent protein translocase protein TatB [Methylobacterium oryzae CBMB20]
MLDMSWGEVMLIGGVALIVIGPKDLPKALRTCRADHLEAAPHGRRVSDAVQRGDPRGGASTTSGAKSTGSATPSARGGIDLQSRADDPRRAEAVPSRAGPRWVRRRWVRRCPAPRCPAPETPPVETRSLADATAQLKAEQEAAGTPPVAGTPSALPAAEATQHAAPGVAQDAPARARVGV